MEIAHFHTHSLGHKTSFTGNWGGGTVGGLGPTPPGGIKQTTGPIPALQQTYIKKIKKLTICFPLLWLRKHGTLKNKAVVGGYKSSQWNHSKCSDTPPLPEHIHTQTPSPMTLLQCLRSVSISIPFQALSSSSQAVQIQLYSFIVCEQAFLPHHCERLRDLITHRMMKPSPH